MFALRLLILSCASGRARCILCQLSKAIVSAVSGTDTQRSFILGILNDLTRLETRPVCFPGIAYEWCSVMCENRRSLRDRESLLFTCLEIDFRHLDPQELFNNTMLTRIEHHRELVEVVFKSRKSEAIADLPNALITINHFSSPVYALLGICTEHLVSLHDLVLFSPRLRRLHYTLHRAHRLRGIREGRGGEIR